MSSTFIEWLGDGAFVMGFLTWFGKYTLSPREKIWILRSKPLASICNMWRMIFLSMKMSSFDSDQFPCVPSEYISFHVCLEGLGLCTIVQLFHVTTMLSVVLTLIGRRACYKWNLLFTLNRNIYIDIDIFVAKVLDTLSKTKYGKKQIFL